jgi:hypothetical protein
MEVLYKVFQFVELFGLFSGGGGRRRLFLGRAGRRML